ncbi:E3 ubiquitin-protein ligase rnf8 isoform X2 [Engraulis encrasicolus]|uniref:E3 ubiquitin-protein ligase rnf8 isoform X2 n=1 Tax=Engraulis encrasicolus TaxID=184585 RepID=UPI002FD66AD5
MEETENCTSPSTEDEDDVVENEIWCLQRVGKETDWLHLLENTEVTVGRGMDVTHRLLSLSCPLMISRKHCIFNQTVSGQWTVTDNMSVNGVMVNKERIPAGAPHVLDEGDTISIGLPVNSAAVEYEYKLARRHEQEVKGFLARPLGPGVYSKNLAKHKMAKRKRSTTDDNDVCPSSSPSSKSKAQRKCASPNSHRHQHQQHQSPSHSPTRHHPPTLPPPPDPSALSERTQGLSTASQEAGPSDPTSTNNITSVHRSKRTTPTATAPVEDFASGASDSESTEHQDLGSLQDCSQNMLALREQVESTQRQVAALEGQLQGGCEQEDPRGLRARLEALRDELRSHQKQALNRMKSLEKTYCDEERRLEMEKSQQKEEGIRKQLEQALQEHRKVIEELKNSCQGFEEILQAKDKELEEEKEKAKAQKAEVVTQMTEVLESELQCIICSELFIEAVTLNCAHSFCLHCIRAWRQRKDECPICRQAIRSEARSLVLDNCIDRMVEQLSADMKERRHTLITQRKGESAGPRESPALLQEAPGDQRRRSHPHQRGRQRRGRRR